MSEPRWLNESQKQAWLGILAILHRGMPEIERTLKAHDLLAVQYQVLVVLSETPERTMGLSQLAGVANVSQSRLTHRMRSLVQRGDVVIAPDPDDGRAKKATLTDQGLARLESVVPEHVEDVQRLIFDHLDADQTDALAEAVTIVADSLCQHPEYLNPSA